MVFWLFIGISLIITSIVGTTIAVKEKTGNTMTSSFVSKIYDFMKNIFGVSKESTIPKPDPKFVAGTSAIAQRYAQQQMIKQILLIIIIICAIIFVWKLWKSNRRL